MNLSHQLTGKIEDSGKKNFVRIKFLNGLSRITLHIYICTYFLPEIWCDQDKIRN